MLFSRLLSLALCILTLSRLMFFICNMDVSMYCLHSFLSALPHQPHTFWLILFFCLFRKYVKHYHCSTGQQWKNSVLRGTPLLLTPAISSSSSIHHVLLLPSPCRQPHLFRVVPSCSSFVQMTYSCIFSYIHFLHDGSILQMTFYALLFYLICSSKSCLFPKIGDIYFTVWVFVASYK